MGFRQPVETAAGVPTSLDTANTDTQRVVITETGGSEGGGAVLLYTGNATDTPGQLQSGRFYLDGEPVTLLLSPANDGQLGTLLVLRAPGPDGTGGGIDVVGAGSSARVDLGGLRLRNVAAPADAADVARFGDLPLLARGTAGTRTTNTSGDITIAHGLSWTPAYVDVVSRQTGSYGFTFQVHSITSTSFTFRTHYNDAVAVSSSVTFGWFAIG